MTKLEDGDLSLKLISLKHILRLLDLSSSVATYIEQSGLILNKNSDKLQSFAWGIRTFESIIPEKFYDDEYIKDLKALKFNENTIFQYWQERLRLIIGLIHRLNILDIPAQVVHSNIIE